MELEEIKSLIKKHSISTYQISQDTNLSQPGLDKLLKGISKNPHRKTLNVLSEYLRKIEQKSYTPTLDNLSVNEPFEMSYYENKNSNQFIKLENGQHLMVVPLLEFNVQAGFLDHYQDLEYLNSLSKHSLIVDKPAQGRYLAFRVSGDSMDSGGNDAIMPNSIATARELQRQHWTNKLRYLDFPYWIIYTTQARMPLLKQITNHDTEKGIITCHSLNNDPGYTDFDLSINDIQALFYVVDIHRTVANKNYY